MKGFSLRYPPNPSSLYETASQSLISRAARRGISDTKWAFLRQLKSCETWDRKKGPLFLFEATQLHSVDSAHVRGSLHSADSPGSSVYCHVELTTRVHKQVYIVNKLSPAHCCACTYVHQGRTRADAVRDRKWQFP